MAYHLATIAIFLAACISGCQLIPPDNGAEEALENFILQETGVNVDFTGDTPE